MLNVLIAGAVGQLGSAFRYLSVDMKDKMPESNDLEGAINLNFIFVARKGFNIQKF
jgi:hypothetical protein